MPVLLELPEDLRGELKEPLGAIYTDAEVFLADATEPIVAVGDVVTNHLLEAGYHPTVALVDGRTKREPIDREIRDAYEGFDHVVRVENPAASLTDDVLRAVRDGLDRTGTTLIEVDGEEDLVALPAILAVPNKATVVYGQPDEGMVLARADCAARSRARALLERFDGDHERVFELIRP